MTSVDFDRRRALGGICGAAAGMFLGTPALAASRADKKFATTWRFGDVSVTKVMDLESDFDAARAFPGENVAELDANADWLAPHFYVPEKKAIRFSYHAYFVKGPNFLVVVDGGQGNDKKRGGPFENMRKGPFLDNMCAAGFAAEQVTHVMCTHFHSDHTGWNTRLVDGRWEPTFPNARYFFNKVDLDAVEARLAKGGAVKAAYDDSILPILERKKAEAITTDYDVGRGVKIIQTPGHTPGHMSLTVDSRGKRANLCGDMIHNPIEFMHPEWTVMFDEDKDAAKVARRRFVDENTDVDVVILTAHFCGPTAGRIVTNKQGKRWFKTVDKA